MKKLLIPSIFTLWLAGILTTFYVVQKPDLLQVSSGFVNLLFTILISLWMAFLSTALGSLFLPQADYIERLSIGTALGLAVFGLSGFGMAMIHLSNPIALLTILFLLTGFFLWKGTMMQVRNDLRQFIQEIITGTNRPPAWIAISAVTTLAMAFLLGLAPPVEDFDALFYHLTVPAIWLRQGAATDFVPNPHYWYPQIVEGSYFWPMALGSDTAPHLLHLLWLILSMILLWQWAKRTAGNTVAWNSILILITMPSLPWLAAWAYTDYALTFAALATLYSLWKWKISQQLKWLTIGGLMAGLAVSVKYTGFIVPVTGVILILIWERDLRKAFSFGILCTLAASPWYLRNWIETGNPIYPFIFGGSGWDTFLAQAYAASGTGIGWKLISLLALPITATLGIYDANFFDGRIGPFFLILAPLSIFVFWSIRQNSNEQKAALQAIFIFSLIGIAFWTLGVVNSAHLFQTRLLFPVLFPLTIPLAIGLDALPRFDIPKFKFSFIVHTMLFIAVMINLVDLGLQTTVRNPLAVTLGMNLRQDYIAKRQPGYASALVLIETAPKNAVVYFLFEPRSYGMNITVQPDAINANFAHDLWLHKSPEAMIAAWEQQGFTHVLISNTGADFMFENESTTPLENSAFAKLKELLLEVKTAPDGTFTLYQIP